MPKSSDVIDEARKWLGVPFQHQGRTRFGIDCAGLVEQVALALGVLPAGYRAPRNYARRPNGTMHELVTTYCAKLARAEPGCIVLFQFPKATTPGHIGICTGATLIHAHARTRRVVEHGYREPWLGWTHSTWRLPGLAHE